MSSLPHRETRVTDFMGWLSGEMPSHGSRSRISLGKSEQLSGGWISAVGGQRRHHQQNQLDKLPGFSPEETNDFRQVFEFYDVDNAKTIDLSDLNSALRAVGFKLEKTEINEIISLMKVDEDTTLDFSEFCMIIEHIKDLRGHYGELRNAFRLLDSENKGVIPVDEFVEIMTSCPDEMSMGDINKIIELGSKDNRKTINYEELIRAMKHGAKHELLQKAATNLLTKFVQSSKSCESLIAAPDKSPAILQDRAVPKTSQAKRQESYYREEPEREAEFIDSVPKAIGGPMLLVSSIIIAASIKPTSMKPKLSKWPSTQKVLSTTGGAGELLKQ